VLPHGSQFLRQGLGLGPRSESPPGSCCSPHSGHSLFPGRNPGSGRIPGRAPGDAGRRDDGTTL